MLQQAILHICVYFKFILYMRNVSGYSRFHIAHKISTYHAEIFLGGLSRLSKDDIMHISIAVAALISPHLYLGLSCRHRHWLTHYKHRAAFSQ